jgi:Holliday junction resolvase RusA-like endonuclease
MSLVELMIPGKPETAGSKRAFTPLDKDGNPYRSKTTGRIVTNVVDDNKKSRGFKNTVAAIAQEAWWSDGHRGPVTDALVVVISFYLARPKGHYGTGRNSEKLKPSAPARPTKKPDVLKLARAVEDALTGIIYADDAQIVDEHIHKYYADDGCERTLVFVSEFSRSETCE